MMTDTILGICIPFLGTALGAACVFFMRENVGEKLVSALNGFAAGIMVAASVWSLLIPSIERADHLGTWSFLPATIGLIGGVLFLMLLDVLIPSLYDGKSSGEKGSRLMMAVTLHNIPEGMAVGAVFAGVLAGEHGITVAAAMALSLGVAIQNFPEGAIISMPCKTKGLSRSRSFLLGMLSGAVEPLGACITILAVQFIVPILPVLLGFAAGAMLYVVVEELVPEIAESGYSRVGNLMFAVGFSLMMSLDIALGGS